VSRSNMLPGPMKRSRVGPSRAKRGRRQHAHRLFAGNFRHRLRARRSALRRKYGQNMCIGSVAWTDGKRSDACMQVMGEAETEDQFTS